MGLGIASAGFHWTRSKGWHKADIVAIYYMFATIFITSKNTER